MLSRLIFTSSQEAATGEYKFSEELPSIISRVVLFMYTSKYYIGKPPDFIQQL